MSPYHSCLITARSWFLASAIKTAMANRPQAFPLFCFCIVFIIMILCCYVYYWGIELITPSSQNSPSNTITQEISNSPCRIRIITIRIYFLPASLYIVAQEHVLLFTKPINWPCLPNLHVHIQCICDSNISMYIYLHVCIN